MSAYVAAVKSKRDPNSDFIRSRYIYRSWEEYENNTGTEVIIVYNALISSWIGYKRHPCRHFTLIRQI